MAYYVSYRRQRVGLHATEAAARADMVRLAGQLRRQGLQVRRVTQSIYQVRAGRAYAPESIVVGWDGPEGSEPRRAPSARSTRAAGAPVQLRLFNPARGFTVRKLAPKPRRAIGYRTLAVNARQWVRVALLPGGGSRAYELLTRRKGA